MAVWLPASLVGQIRAIERPARPGLRWTTEDQWHVTLRFLGEVEEERLDLPDRLASVASRSAAVPAALGARPRKLGDRVWILPVDGLDVLASAIQEATSDIGQRAPAGQRFRGHLTLARGRRPECLSDLPTRDFAGVWTVSELTLVRSELHPDGARYEVIGRWPLGSPDPRAV